MLTSGFPACSGKEQTTATEMSPTGTTSTGKASQPGVQGAQFHGRKAQDRPSCSKLHCQSKETGSPWRAVMEDSLG